MELVKPRHPDTDDGGIEREAVFRALGGLLARFCFSHHYNLLLF